MEPSEQAVEAASDAIYNTTATRAFMQQPDPTVDDIARAALSAALPIIRQELAELIDHDIEWIVEDRRFSEGRERAARIVRGDHDD